MSKRRQISRRTKKRESKGRMRNFLMFLPNMVRLSGSLLMDNRVPVAEKALFAASIVYAISPIDLIPDIFPFIGQIDDIYLISLTLLRLLNYTEESVVRQHWRGGGDIVALASSVASIAPAFLPQRVSRVLSSKVRMGSAGEVIGSLSKGGKKVIEEIPAEEKPKEIKIDSSSRMNN